MAILNFMTRFPGQGKWTNFEYKIIYGLYHHGKISSETASELSGIRRERIVTSEQKPKRHTIRLDQYNRWKVGMMIDFFVNARTKNMKRFAPRVPVKSLQAISVSWKTANEFFHVLDTQIDKVCLVEIDGRFFGEAYLFEGKVISKTETLEQLAINDGFDTVQEFFEWFHEDFSGKIIHWTDLKY